MWRVVINNRLTGEWMWVVYHDEEIVDGDVCDNPSRAFDQARKSLANHRLNNKPYSRTEGGPAATDPEADAGGQP